MQDAQNPLVIVGQGALTRADGAAVLSLAAKVATAHGAVKEGWTGFAVIQTAASRVGALALGLTPKGDALDAKAMAKGGVDVLFNLGADEIDIAPGAFVVYLGTHGDKGAHRADVILPGATYTEKSGLTLNTEGRVRLLNRAAFPPGEAREDWSILRALSAELGATLPFDSLAQLRGQLASVLPSALAIGSRLAADPADLAKLAAKGGAVTADPFTNVITDFYLTNPIARASAIMAECSSTLGGPVKAAAE